MKRTKDSLKNLQDDIKHANICIMRVPEREKNEKRAECLFKGAEKFPNLEGDMDIQIHEAHRSPYRFNSEKTSLRHIIIKLSKNKNKERILKAEKKLFNSSHASEPSIRLSVKFSAEKRRAQSDMYKVLKEKKKFPPKNHNNKNCSAKYPLAGKLVLQK